MLGFRQDMFKIGLSYDITVSSLAARSGGTYELTFGLFLTKAGNDPQTSTIVPDVSCFIIRWTVDGGRIFDFR
jgi:hypothetical protein